MSEQWVKPFVASLARLLGSENRDRDSATLAKLRRGLTRKAADRDIWVYSHLWGAAPQHEEWAALIASLFALWHQGGDGMHRQAASGSLGVAFRQLRERQPESESVARRFAVLLDSHPDDLPIRLRHAVSLLRSYGVAIDWVQLLGDLLHWNAERRPVQRRWAREFWAGRATPEPTADAPDAEIVAASPTANPVSEETDNDR